MARQDTTTMNDLALLNLVNLVSPALPIGCYAWSQGLESAVERDWVSDEEGLLNWLLGLLEHSLCRLDVPMVQRCHRAWAGNDRASFLDWNERTLASRETQELRQEDAQTGTALIKLLSQLPSPERDSVSLLAKRHISLPAAFAVTGVCWSLHAKETALAFLWSWAENQVAAGIKLIPVGQTAGQRVLQQLKPAIANGLAEGLALSDEEIGSGLPGLALASSIHETQYSRLFRS